MNIVDEICKMAKKHFEDAEAEVSIKKNGGEIHVEIKGSTATILVLTEDMLATMLTDCFGRDEAFIGMIVDTFAKNVKALVKEKNNDRS